MLGHPKTIIQSLVCNGKFLYPSQWLIRSSKKQLFVLVPEGSPWKGESKSKDSPLWPI